LVAGMARLRELTTLGYVATRRTSSASGSRGLASETSTLAWGSLKATLFRFPTDPSSCFRIFLATKFANRYNLDGSVTVDSSPKYVKEACEKSLKRLGIDCIDLYYW
jgi:hypothetical protein